MYRKNPGIYFNVATGVATQHTPSPLQEKMKTFYKEIEIELRDVLLSNNRKAVTSLIERKSLMISKLAVKASHLCNAMLNDLFQENVPIEFWPDLDNDEPFFQMFLQGTSLEGENQHHQIQNTWAKHFTPVNYPPGEGTISDIKAIYYSAVTFKRKVERYLRMQRLTLQKLAVDAYLTRNQIAKENRLINALLRIMNIAVVSGGDDLKQIEREHIIFIQSHRRFLSKRCTITEYLSYYQFLRQQRVIIDLFSLVPIMEIKNSQIALTTHEVHELCEAVRFRPSKTVKKWNAWSEIFDMGKIRSLLSDNHWIFDGLILTDGVACTIRYSSVLHARVGGRISNVSGGDKIIIGIDPGERNLVACVEMIPKTQEIVAEWLLSKTDFFQMSGITSFNEKMKLRHEKHESYRKAVEDLSHKSNIFDYIKAFAQHHETIWAFNVERSIRKDKLFVNRRIRVIIDEFVAKIIRGRRNVHIAFGGNIDIPSRDKNWGGCEFLRNPNKFIFKSMKRLVGKENISLIDEWNTTRVCHRCFSILGCVDERHRVCRNSECPNYYLIVDRDLNAAANMANKLIFSPTPRNLRQKYMLTNHQTKLA